jgi:antitoxin MazE
VKPRIVRTGSSPGVRLPKPLQDQTGLSDEVEVEAQGNQLVIRPVRAPRTGWAEAFADWRRPGTILCSIPTSRRPGSIGSTGRGSAGHSPALRRIPGKPGSDAGSEIRTRPCAIVSPEETNRHTRTVIVAP